MLKRRAAQRLLTDLAERLANRPQITTDGLRTYLLGRRAGLRRGRGLRGADSRFAARHARNGRRRDRSRLEYRRSLERGGIGLRASTPLLLDCFCHLLNKELVFLLGHFLGGRTELLHRFQLLVYIFLSDFKALVVTHFPWACHLNHPSSGKYDPEYSEQSCQCQNYFSPSQKMA